jgi:hypothetical protein
LINIKSLFHGLEWKNLNGVLWGESSNFLTEILVYNGIVLRHTLLEKQKFWQKIMLLLRFL